MCECVHANGTICRELSITILFLQHGYHRDDTGNEEIKAGDDAFFE